MKVKTVVILSTCLLFSIITGVTSLALRTQAERNFAEYLLIREVGIYTLVGSKPILECDMVPLIEHREPIPDSVKGPAYRSKTGLFLKDPQRLWQKWKRHQFTNSQNFALIELPPEDDYKPIYFINKKLTRETLKQHYSLFVQQTGEDFDIEKVVSEIANPTSFFWTNIFKSNTAFGLLYGYGLENTEHFAVDQQKGFKEKPKFSNPLFDITKAHTEKTISLVHLPLPTFRIFSDNDPQVEHYKKERERIQAQYKNADLRKLLIQAFAE